MKGWIARDMDGAIYFYLDKPIKGYAVWISSYEIYDIIDTSVLPNGLNPQWSDTEPIEVEAEVTIKIKK